MTLILLGGAIVGIGVLVLGLVIAPPKTNPATALLQLESARRRAHADRVAVARLDPNQLAESPRLRELGRWLSTLLEKSGIEAGGLRSDLSLIGRTMETHLAFSALAGVGGFFAPIVFTTAASYLNLFSLGSASAGLSLIGAALGAVLPSLSIRPQAAERRRDFRHVVGSFLDLVAMNLAGGRGVPEALQQASEVSDGWAMIRIRDTLQSARLHGVTPWAALGELGDEVKLDELRDLAASLALVAEDGAKVRESLAARATSMRKRELSEAEGKAGEKSQSMLVAQLLLCAGFMIFLMYPATVKFLG